MTLILAIPTKGPLVFTPDKRLIVGANQYDDAINKLVLIGQAAVGSAFGAVRHLGVNPQQVRFDMYVLMRDFFANGVYTPERLAQFNQHIPQQFAHFRATYRNNDIIDTLFQAIFYTWQATATMRSSPNSLLGTTRISTTCAATGTFNALSFIAKSRRLKKSIRMRRLHSAGALLRCATIPTRCFTSVRNLSARHPT
jgi:hypothetical protein